MKLKELFFAIHLFSLTQLFRKSLQAPLVTTITNEQVPAATEDS
jgi:hypothetical protein